MTLVNLCILWIFRTSKFEDVFLCGNFSAHQVFTNWALVIYGSGNGLLPVVSKPLPKPTLSYYKLDPQNNVQEILIKIQVLFTIEKHLKILSAKWYKKCHGDISNGKVEKITMKIFRKKNMISVLYLQKQKHDIATTNTFACPHWSTFLFWLQLCKWTWITFIFPHKEMNAKKLHNEVINRFVSMNTGQNGSIFKNVISTCTFIFEIILNLYFSHMDEFLICWWSSW